MRAPSIRPYKVYCGNFTCPSRLAGRLFEVIDTTGMTAGERAELLIEGGEPRFDGELRDGEVWTCSDCANTVGFV